MTGSREAADDHGRSRRRRARPARPPRRRAARSRPPRTHRGAIAHRLCRGVDALRRARQGQSGRAFRHGRGGRLVARAGVRLQQASAALRLGGESLVHGLPAGRLGLLSARHGPGRAGVVDRLDPVGAVARGRETGGRARAAHAGAVLQFPCAEIQREHGADPAVGGNDAVVFALVRNARPALGGGAAYIAAPIVLAAAATRPSAAAILDTLWPATAHRRIAAVAFWAPLLLAILVGLAAQVLISSLWIMSAVTLLPVVLMSSPLVGMRRGALPLLLGVAIAVPVLATLAAPAIAYVIHRKGVPHHAQRYRLVAEAVDRAWRATTTQPMGLVGSDTALGNGVAFYLSDRPSTLDVLDPRRTPWANEARIARQGIALVCAVEETDCMNAVAALASGLSRGKRSEIELARNYLGAAGKPERYWIITVPPQF